jgi:hypothetical protein
MEKDIKTDDSAYTEINESELKGGIIRFFGLYWRKDLFLYGMDKQQLVGSPSGLIGKGRHGKDADDSQAYLNFWMQKGVYILYDANLVPVYCGQAGTERNYNERKNSGENGIGQRLKSHATGIYRNGWSFFSWYGFLNTDLKPLRTLSRENRISPAWSVPDPAKLNMNSILNSMEGIVISGFIPRFNNRGGDLRDATECRQYERQPYIIEIS